MHTHFKNCFSLIATFFIFSLAIEAAHLDINRRPAAVSEAIAKKYLGLATSEPKGWSYNGADKYSFMSLDDDSVVKKIVDESTGQKVFNLLDVGAGDHSWAKARMKYVNEKFAGRDIHFNIFSLTGDAYKEEGYVEKEGVNIVEIHEGVSSLYKLSAFPVENMIEKFRELGYFELLSHQVDLSVAAYTLMHLVDPVGTFLQMYNLARPNQGLIFVENFFRMNGHDDAPVRNFLDDTQLEFFMRYGSNSFAVRRSAYEGKFPYNYNPDDTDIEHRAKLINTEPKNEQERPNFKNTLKRYGQDNGSPSLRDFLPFKE